MEERKYRTRFALRALDLADVWNAQFSELRLGTTSKRRAVLSVPEGQSTAGGTQAQQSISLVPEDPSKGILVAGSVDGVSLTSELRGFSYLNETHRLRFGKPLDLPAGVYQDFLAQAERLLKVNGFTVTVVNQLPEAVRRRYQAAKPSSGSSGIWVILVFLLAAGGAAVAYLLLNG